MAHLHYMALSGIGAWTRVLTDSGAQLAPYRTYLKTAQTAQTRNPPAVAWELASPALSERLNARLRRASERGGPKGWRRRQRSAAREVPDGVWVCLYPPPWKADADNELFKAFLDLQAKVLDRPLRRKDRGDAVLAYDTEARAILLERAPEPIDDPDPQDPRRVGQLLFAVPNTYTLDRQIQALQTLESQPPARCGPLLALATSVAQWRPVVPEEPREDWVFLDKPDRDGTDEQRRFVEVALGTPDFAILDGPPGSGKTTAICELIVQLARAGKRVLLVASTHVAVDNVLERLLAKQDASAEKWVLPVRVGDEQNVTSEEVKAWSLSRLRKTWRDEIQDFLDDPTGGTSAGDQARAILAEALQDGGSDESPIVSLLLDSANLVCGTTIGILRHPAIKRGSTSADTAFDYLILDEASKTPLAEFLVPAVLAKRWIVVGDVRQMSPYVEAEDLEENLRDFLPPAPSDAAAYASLARKSPALVLAADAESAHCLTLEATARDVRYVHLDRHDPKELLLDLLHADLVFGSAGAMRAFEHRLPGELVATSAGIPNLPAWEARRTALASVWRDLTPREEPVSWASEVAWRLVRSYELRQNAAERDQYQRALNDLMPTNLPNEGRQELFRQLDTVRRVAMPSILELLQRGFERLPGKPDFGVALTDGLPPAALRQRLVSLSFQHRMHPDISAFPRDQFYQVEGDPRGRLLRDASGIEEERAWAYPRYRGGRAVWMNVHAGRARGNRNPVEVKRVVQELEAFVAWARGQRRPSEGPWEVAVLTFYRGQEELLCDALQELSGLGGNTRNFSLPRDLPPAERPVHVTLCTVDRFQGHEADMVLLSFTKTGSVGFLNSPNRLNVAITRARYQLVLIGDREFFASDRCKSPLLRALAGSKHYPVDLTWETRP